jgi:hypothetical protein
VNGVPEEGPYWVIRNVCVTSSKIHNHTGTQLSTCEIEAGRGKNLSCRIIVKKNSCSVCGIESK